MPNTAPVIHSDPDILGGTPVFVGTRVPFRNLIDSAHIRMPAQRRWFLGRSESRQHG